MIEHRVAVFVDAQNLYHAAKSFAGPDYLPDYEAIFTRALIEAGAFLGVDWRRLIVDRQVIYTVSKQRTLKFQRALERIGYEVNSQIVHGEHDTFDWDAKIVVDVMNYLHAPVAGRLQGDRRVVVIVSGDGDFAHLQELDGADFVFMAFPGSGSSRFKVLRNLDHSCVYEARKAS